MNNAEAAARIHALDAWVARYPRSNTFRQFWDDYKSQDPELEEFIAHSDRNTWDDDVRNALDMLGEGMDTGGFLYSRDRPYRRIEEGPSHGDYRDQIFDELYSTLPHGYQVSAEIAEVFEPIKARLHSS